MEKRTATILGATGLIGSRLIKLLRQGSYFSKIRVISRRPLELADTGIDVRVIDFENLNAFKLAITGSDAVFCAVGTTNKKVKGDKDAYRKVDYEIPVHAAELCAETGCQLFLLVSSVGASSKSSNFYLHLKGEVEDAISDMNIGSVSVFRPSMLLGERAESRPAELIAKALSAPFSFLFPGKYKPVEGTDVARAMISASKKELPGFHIYHYGEIMDLSRKF